jgi:hypothetical protein
VEARRAGEEDYGRHSEAIGCRCAPGAGKAARGRSGCAAGATGSAAVPKQFGQWLGFGFKFQLTLQRWMESLVKFIALQQFAQQFKPVQQFK